MSSVWQFLFGQSLLDALRRQSFPRRLAIVLGFFFGDRPTQWTAFLLISLGMEAPCVDRFATWPVVQLCLSGLGVLCLLIGLIVDLQYNRLGPLALVVLPITVIIVLPVYLACMTCLTAGQRTR